MDLTAEDTPLPESLDEIVQVLVPSSGVFAGGLTSGSLFRRYTRWTKTPPAPDAYRKYYNEYNDRRRVGNLPMSCWNMATKKSSFLVPWRSPSKSTLIGEFPGIITTKAEFDREGIEEDDQMVLLNRLTSWLSHLVNTQAAPFVIRKMCSTLAVFFTHFPRLWRRCIRHLVCCICNEPIALDSIDQQPPTSEIIRNSPMKMRIPLLWFCSTLVQEVGKLDPKFIQK